MLRQQKIYDDDTANADTSTSNVSDDTNCMDGKSSTTVPNKPTLMHTYSNLSDKSFAAAEPPYTLQTTLVQLNFVKSSFTVNPVMVSSNPISIQMKKSEKSLKKINSNNFIAEHTCAFIFARR